MASTTRNERRREQQRQEILLIARDLFLHEGPSRFTMRKLAGKVNCALGTLYLYFKDKDELLAILVEESFERLMHDLEQMRRVKTPIEFLEELMRNYIAFGLANPNHYYFAFMLRRTASLEKARPRPHRSYTLLRNTLNACVEQSLIRPMDVDLASQIVWAGIHGVTSLMITMPRFPWMDKDVLVDHVVFSLLDGLKPGMWTEGKGHDD